MTMMEQDSGGIAAVAAAEEDAPAVPDTLEVVRQDPATMTPEEQARIAKVAANVAEVVEQAEAIEVRNAAEAQAATEFLARIAREKKDSEAARTFLVKPLNDHVKNINAEFKPKTDVLAAADAVVRQKVLAYESEQEKLRAAEQARLDAERRRREEAAEEERRKAEAAAAEERQRAAREAAAAEAARRKAEEAAAAADREAANKMEREMREMTTEGLDAEYRLSRNPKRKQAAQDEMKRRAAIQEAEAARQRAEAAAAAEEAAREAEQAAHDAPLPDVPQVEVATSNTLRAPSGSASKRKRWVFEVEDAARVPERFKLVDEKAIRKAVADGERSIPGVRIYEETGLSVRAS